MSYNYRLFFKFKPSIDVENEYTPNEDLIGAYFEGIHMLLGEKELIFDLNNSEDSLSVTCDKDCWSVSRLKVPKGDWEHTIVELTLLNKNGEQKVNMSIDMISDVDAWKLLKFVFEKTGYEGYKDVYEFYGYELS